MTTLRETAEALFAFIDAEGNPEGNGLTEDQNIDHIESVLARLDSVEMRDLLRRAIGNNTWREGDLARAQALLRNPP